MTDEQVCETVEKYGANREECARLNASLSCLRNVHMSGEQTHWGWTLVPNVRRRSLGFLFPHLQAGLRRSRFWMLCAAHEQRKGAWGSEPEVVRAAALAHPSEVVRHLVLDN